ncbi:MAG: hypothetical protein ACFFER_03065, partial [Candidatus Thorarchaeota archaeon]
MNRSETVELHSSNRKDIISDSFDRLKNTSIFAILSTVSVGFFVIVSRAPQMVIIDILRICFGGLTIFLLPGFALVNLGFPEDLRTVEFAIILGFISTIITIQTAVNLLLIFNINLDLVCFISFSSLAIIICSLLILRFRGVNELNIKSSKLNGRPLLFLITGAGIRTLMLFFTQGALSPDAALYANYARNMLAGEFNSLILGDPASFDFVNGVQYVLHQAFVYAFTISLAIVPGLFFAPTLILVLIGTLLIAITHSLTDVCFGTRAATWITIILSFHPLFIFHSSIGYGPEITSLLFLIFSLLLLLVAETQGRWVYGAGGLVFGLIDVTWYPNFYISCIVFPILLLGLERISKKEAVSLEFIMFFVLLSRLVVGSFLLFWTLWFVATAILLITSQHHDFRKIAKLIPFHMGMLVIILYWRWPFQAGLLQTGQNGISFVGTATDAILAPLTLELVLRFCFFVVFHTSPIIIIFLMFKLVRMDRSWTSSMSFIIAGLIAALGTLKMFSLFTKATLVSIYIYSDSRFFLFIALMFTLSCAGVFTHISNSIEYSNGGNQKWKKSMVQKRRGLLAIIIIIGLIPSYLLMPTGLTLINIEDRYGWMGLSSIVNPLGDEDTIFLANRVREFSWYTSRRCAFLEFSDEGLTNLNASLEMVGLAINFSAQYLLIDGYTIAKWKTLEFLLYDPISVGETINLNATFIDELAG